jgi:hypothetical protein
LLFKFGVVCWVCPWKMQFSFGPTFFRNIQQVVCIVNDEFKFIYLFIWLASWNNEFNFCIFLANFMKQLLILAKNLRECSQGDTMNCEFNFIFLTNFLITFAILTHFWSNVHQVPLWKMSSFFLEEFMKHFLFWLKF